ncbi:MAG TPA: cupin domain-containing protein, partial [Terriglobales bacterium]|nr:cupin domain-containing protein [Terriglobales bacterium]
MTEKHEVTRRRILKSGVAALATAGTFTTAFAQQAATPAADRSASNPGPGNPPLAQQNQDSFMPPSTDHGDEPAFKYSFSLSHNRTYKGGWARQVTVRDFPISRDLAGVNMRLTSGGIRELHWHVPAEWAYMIYGKARITAVDSQGRSFVQDVGQGDLWYFPSGIPHSIQGLAPDGCEFLLVFDDGGFSEFDTFQISDWMAHTPREVLAKN